MFVLKWVKSAVGCALYIFHLSTKNGAAKMAGNLKSVKSFASIPGPRSYPLIGTLGSYLLTKKYRFDRLHWNGRNKFDEFGPIVKEEIVPGI